MAPSHHRLAAGPNRWTLLVVTGTLCGADGELRFVTAMEPTPVAGSDSFAAGYTAGEPITRTIPEALDLRDAA